MLVSIKRMLDCFEKYGIKYCHWKSNEHIDEALEGNTDLDILFLPSQRHLLEQALSEAGLKRFRATPLMQYNAIEDYIGFDKEKAKIWHLHLHYRLSLGEKHLKGYTVPWNEYIISRRYRLKKKENEIYCSDPNDEYFLLLVRMALKLRWRDLNKKISGDDLIEIKWLKTQINNEEILFQARNLLGENIKKCIRDLLKIDLKHRNQLLKLQQELRKQMIDFSSYNRVSSWLTRTKREIFWLFGGIKRRLGFNSLKANRRIAPSGGTVVAILGCDGAGKSTTLSYIKKEFNKKIDVYSIYLGSGDGKSSLIRSPMKIVAKKIGGKGIGNAVDKEININEKMSFKSRIYIIAKIIWAVVLASEKKKKLKKITKARNHGLLVLIDCYPQVEVSGYSDGPLLTKYLYKKGMINKLAKWEYRIYKKAYNNGPDLLIKLTVPTNLAIKRKPEMTVEEIERKKNAVNLIHSGKKEIVIDTSKEMNDSLAEAMEAIWRII